MNHLKALPMLVIDNFIRDLTFIIREGDRVEIMGGGSTKYFKGKRGGFYEIFRE